MDATQQMQFLPRGWLLGNILSYPSGVSGGWHKFIYAYDRGVKDGAFGLLLNSIFLGIGTFMIEPMCQNLTARIVWVISNFMVFLSLAGMVIVSFWSARNNKGRIGADRSVMPK